jgi:HPt (histidine-containing phosphotransfer) domain-containing protein
MTFSIEHLQERFRSGMERRLATIDEALVESRFEEIERMFHSIAGIGGTYGHPAVSEIASAAEELCGEALRAGRVLSEIEMVDVRVAVRSIRHECRLSELLRKAS